MLTISLIQRCFLLFFLFVISNCNAGHPGCPNIVTKEMWGGRSISNSNLMVTPVEYVIIAHTVTPECHNVTACSNRLTNIQDYHINTKKFRDIAYNFLIGSDGKVYEGVGWHKVGAHTRGWNSKALGIAFIGDFSEKLPAQNAIDVTQALLRCAIEGGELKANYKLIGHRQVTATLSPGSKLYYQIATWPHFTQDP